jgi:hypothetical protein
MKFKELLEVLESDEQLTVTVTNEWGDGVYDGTVEEFREEKLLLDLRVCRIFTRIIKDDEHFDIRSNRKALTTEIEVTLYDDEQKIIYPED